MNSFSKLIFAVVRFLILDILDSQAVGTKMVQSRKAGRMKNSPRFQPRVS
jgi:hypothetical protein